MTERADIDNYEFSPIPESLEGFTSKWCENALKKFGIIQHNTKVVSVDIQRMTNDETGAKDGGGMTVARLIRLCLKYDGETTGKEPKCIVAKAVLTGDLQFKFGLKKRLLVNTVYGKGFEEQMMRRDIKFCREVIPVVSAEYRIPKIYYTGITDGGDRSFFEAVIRNTPHRIRTLTLMEDMKGWRTQMPGTHLVTYQEAVACLKNVAVLHASFWNERNQEIKAKFDKDFALSEIEFRHAGISKFVAKGRQRFLSDSSSLQEKIKKALDSWATHPYFKIQKDSTVPEWFLDNDPVEEEGTFFILKHPYVVEMLQVFAERYPEFNRSAGTAYIERPPQTLLHGDCHNGNHMYDKQENGEVKVVAFDYQFVGLGMAISDLMNFFRMSLSLSTYSTLSS